jgi:hypothetical protein
MKMTVFWGVVPHSFVEFAEVSEVPAASIARAHRWSISIRLHGTTSPSHPGVELLQVGYVLLCEKHGPKAPN